MKTERKIYLVINPYYPDTGICEYGAYITYELAQQRIVELSGEDNEYGKNINEDDVLDIHTIYVNGEL